MLDFLRKARACAEQGGEGAAPTSNDTSWPESKVIRTGTRCTTLTQLPLAFCGGRIANCAPVPGLTELTVPWNVWSGKESTSMSTFWPTLR